MKLIVLPKGKIEEIPIEDVFYEHGIIVRSIESDNFVGTVIHRSFGPSIISPKGSEISRDTSLTNLVARHSNEYKFYQL